VSAHDSARAVDEYSDDDEEDDEEEEEDDEMNQDCCCITCRESIRAKGGCCTRNVFCGWLSGKPPKVPTKASLMREQEMKNKRLIKDSIKAVGGGIGSVNKTVKGVVVAGSSKLTKSGGTNNVDDGGEEDVVGTAEVAAVASEEVEENNKVTEAEEAIAITKKTAMILLPTLSLPMNIFKSVKRHHVVPCLPYESSSSLLQPSSSSSQLNYVSMGIVESMTFLNLSIVPLAS